MRLVLLLLILFSSCSKKQERLYLFTWSDFISEEVIADFEKKYDCEVVIDSYDSNESMYAKLRSGGIGYDIAFPTLYFEEILARQGLILEIDPSKLPNYKNLDWQLLNTLDIPPCKDCIPYLISYTGIGYRQDRVLTSPNSWRVFADRKYKGRMTMLNDVREVFGAALLTLSLDVNTTNPNEIEKAEQLLLTWKPNLAKFESEQYKNGIASVEYLVVQGYSSDLFQVIEEDPQVRFILPSEGAIISCDMITLINNDRPKELAYHFINYLLDPAVALKNMEKTKALAPNKIAIERLSPDLKALLIQDPEILKRSQIIKDIGKDQTLYFDAWERIKERD